MPHACACSRAPACACARAHAFVSRARLRRRQVEDAGASLGPEGRRALQCAVLALALLLLRRLGQKGVRLVTVATATAYPVYASFKTLESSNLEAHRRWLVYWLCLGIASCLEGTADTAMALVPNYSLAKLSALVVCVLCLVLLLIYLIYVFIYLISCNLSYFFICLLALQHLSRCSYLIEMLLLV